MTPFPALSPAPGARRCAHNRAAWTTDDPEDLRVTSGIAPTARPPHATCEDGVLEKIHRRPGLSAGSLGGRSARGAGPGNGSSAMWSTCGSSAGVRWAIRRMCPARPLDTLADPAAGPIAHVGGPLTMRL